MKVLTRVSLALVLMMVMVLGLAGPSMASSTDWSQVGVSAGPPAINCLLNVVSGSNSILYAGSNGVFSWNGSTWAQIDPVGLKDSISCLTMYDSTLYAGTVDNGLYELNGGAWSQVASLAGDPIYCLTTVNGLVYAGSYGFVYSWNGISSAQVGGSVGSDQVDSLAMDSYGTLYAGAGNVYELTSGSNTWAQTSSLYNTYLLTAEGGVVYAGTQGNGVYASSNDFGSNVGTLPGGNIKSITALATANGMVYAAATNDDLYSWNGSGWTLVGGGTTGYSIASLAMSNDTLYAATDGTGLYAMSGATWVPVQPTGSLPLQAEVGSLIMDGSTMYAGILNGGGTTSSVWSYSDNSWTPVGSLTESTNCLTMDGSTLYAGTPNGVYQLSSGGAWSQSGLSENDVCSLLTVNGVVYAGAYGYVYVLDSGGNWDAVGSNIRGVLSENLLYVYSLTMDGSTLYAGTDDGVYSWSSDNGWQPVDYTDLSAYIPSLITVDGVVYAGSGSGVYTLGSDGAWTQLTGPLSSLTRILVANGTLYASVAEEGSVNYWNGASWAEVGSLLEQDQVNDLIANSDNLYAGTYEDGVWVYPLTAPTTYTVTYNANGGTGTVPTDNNSPYAYDAPVTVLGNTTGLTKTGDTFGGWNTAANGSGTTYQANSIFDITANTTLYAVWTATAGGGGATTPPSIPTLSFSPPSGTIAAATLIHINPSSTLSPYESIYDTTSGTTLTATSGDYYSAPFPLSVSATVYAAVYDSVYGWGSPASATYTITAPATGGGGGGGISYYTPTVQTEAATTVAADSAVLNGDITSDNGSDVTDYGFLWGASASSLTNKLDVGANNQSGAFIDTLSGLTAGTTYYFQAYATNSYGTGDGAILNFTSTTSSQAPTPPTTPTGFSDVPPSFWGYGAITNLSVQGIVYGYPNGAFEPNQQITRAEVAVIMDKILNLDPYTPQTPTFNDVNPGDWFYQAVGTANHAGIEIGYNDGTFRPNNPISRQEIACVLIQALSKAQLANSDAQTATKFLDDQQIAWWSRGFVVVAAQNGIVSGYPNNTYQPKNETTRAEACAMVENFLNTQK